MTKDVTFLQKSYGEYSKVEKPVLVTTSCESSDDEEEFEMVPKINNYENSNVVNDSISDNDSEGDNVTFLMKILMMKLKQTPKTLPMPKWYEQ